MTDSRRNNSGHNSANCLGGSPPGGGVILAQYDSSYCFIVAYRRKPRLTLFYDPVECHRNDHLLGGRVFAVT